MLDIETLERSSFERSKMWGKCLKRLGANTNDRTIAIAVPDKELEDEEYYLDDNDVDDSTDSSSMEDLDVIEDEAILKDITNRTSLGQKVLPVRHVGNHTESAACSMYNEVDSAEMQDLLNETMPLLKEHKRKWKEAGLDKVLNTFDPEKIEEKVGGWLRRNHSMASFSECSSKPLPAPPPRASAMKPRTCSVQDSDSESLHSVDTARYIRSSRNRLENRRCRSYSARASMTIKTFRFVQSKRDALREKYACLDSDETLPSGANYYRRRTQSAARAMHLQSQRSVAKRVSAKRSVAHVLHSCRRKRLHKYRHSSSYATSTSLSSSEDDCTGRARYTRRDELQSRRQWLADTPTCRLPGGCRCLMAKGNIWSKASVEGCALCTKRTMEDKRPCMRESECDCYYEGKLCKETRHIADTSTEDWVVENCETPPKQPQPVHQRKLAQSVPAKTRTRREAAKRQYRNAHKSAIENTRTREPCADLEQPRGKSRKKVTRAKPKVKAKAEVANLDEEQPTKKVTRSKARSVTKPKEDEKSTEKAILSGESSPNSTFIRELEFAIEQSKRTFEIERQKKATANAMNTESAKPSTSGLHEDAVLVPEKEGHVRSRESSVDSVSSLVANSSSASSLRSLRPQPRSVKLRKMHKMLTTENTFFTYSHNICNSTAVKGDTATTRQIIVERRALPPIRELSGTVTSEPGTKPKRPNKRVPVVSSTKGTSSSTAGSSAAASPTTDNDCIMVSSSTDLPVPKPVRAAVAQHAPQTSKGILLYAPNRQNLMPAESLKDGFFQVTLEHLSAVIGEQMARKFMKYYMGRRRFARSSSVYYQPPASPCAETDSDDDTLERVGQFGDLYESFDKGGSERH